MEGDFFQDIISAITIKKMFVGSINLKKVPGLATTKKSLAAVIECGILHSQLAALTMEL